MNDLHIETERRNQKVKKKMLILIFFLSFCIAIQLELIDPISKDCVVTKLVQLLSTCCLQKIQNSGHWHYTEVFIQLNLVTNV